MWTLNEALHKVLSSGGPLEKGGDLKGKENRGN